MGMGMMRPGAGGGGAGIAEIGAVVFYEAQTIMYMFNAAIGKVAAATRTTASLQPVDNFVRARGAFGGGAGSGSAGGSAAGGKAGSGGGAKAPPPVVRTPVVRSGGGSPGGGLM